MAYNVVAVAHDRGFVKIGSQDACQIVVSVSDANGKGVGGLKAPNFKISQPGANFSVTFAGPDTTGFPGFYVVDVKPGFPWHKAQYHFCIRVVTGVGKRGEGGKGAKYGQTVTRLDMH